jgi:hypothetical protein
MSEENEGSENIEESKSDEQQAVDKETPNPQTSKFFCLFVCFMHFNIS